MDAREFRDLVNSLIEGDIGEGDYNRLLGYLAGIFRKLSEVLGRKLSEESGSSVMSLISILSREYPTSAEFLSELSRDFVVHLLRKRNRLTPYLDNPRSLKSYVVSSARNFLLDRYRAYRTRVVLQKESEMTNEERERPLENFADWEESLKAYELAEVEELFRKKVPEENIKYFCYFYNSKRYICLWEGKSKSAVYKEVERKGKKVVEDFGLELRRLGVLEELVDEFIKLRLSAICEELRFKYCKEEKS